MYLVEITLEPSGSRSFFGPFPDKDSANTFGFQYPDYQSGEETSFDVFRLNGANCED